MALSEYFSVIALFILFRETVEASIIVAVLLQFLNRSFPHLKRQGGSGGLDRLALIYFYSAHSPAAIHILIACIWSQEQAPGE